jgi:alkylation response protein AidB-like acyl-CoA dehydrogenase/acyl carrier protein
VIEQLAAIDMNAGLFVGLNNYLGVGPIARHGTPKLQDVLLPRLSQGTELAGFAFAEPSSSASTDSLASYAEPVNGSGWRLYGKKYASAGSLDSTMNVFVRHADRAGVTAFVVPQGTSGVVSLAPSSTAVTHGTQSLTRSRVVLDGVYVKHEHVLGEVGQGMNIAMDAMAHAHLAVAAACLGGMKRCAQLVFHYATQRQTTTGRLVAHPVTLAKLGRVTAGVTALECLVQQLALALDSGPSVPPEAFTVCKVVAPEMLWQVVDDLVQLLGRRGYVETPHIRDLVRDAQALRSCEGPSEVMSALLGARLMNGGREGVRRFVSDVLKAPEVEPLIERAIVALRSRGVDRSPSASTGVTYWERARAGELATWIALLAAVEGRRRQQSTGELERAATWTRANFERTLAALADEQPATGDDGDEAITASVSAYARSVGQIDPLLMWGEQPVHPAVAPDSVPPSSEHIAPPPSSRHGAAPASVAPSRGPSSSRDLRAWVKSWLSTRLRVAENQVDPRRSFADHGLDSLAAVEFAKALSDHLGRPLDETLLWNFATIDALVEYLEGSPSRPDTPPSAGQGTGSRNPSASNDGSDLEAEIARLEDELRRR